jgi:4'-phosphopantetheinyl transferase
MATLSNPLVQLNYASLDLLNDKSFSTQIFGWLSSEERKRYKRFENKLQANQYLLARALLRSQLSKRVPSVLPHEWVFVIDAFGKPRLAGEFCHFNLHFNLSHSENLVVLALGEGLNLGVDVEYIHRSVFSMALAKRYFARNEFSALMMLTEKQQTKRITQLWTLKESYLKASGLGIRIPLAELAFCFKGEGDLDVIVSPPWVQFLPAEENSCISLFGLGSDYSLALTIEADKAIDTFAMTINEWAGFNRQLSGLPCELLRNSL